MGKHRTLTLVVVTLVALLLRWYFVTNAIVIHPIRGDATQYYAYAWNMLHHGVFSSTPPYSAQVIPDSFRDPGYPALLAMWLTTGSRAIWYPGILLTQALLGTLTVVLVMLIGQRWLTPGWNFTAGILAAIWPHNIAITSDLLAETLFGFLCALAIWLLVVAFEKRSSWWMSAAGLALGLASLTNAILTPFFLLLVLIAFIRLPHARRLTTVLLFSAAVLPGLWQMRNLNLPFHHSSTNRALINIVQGSWPAYHRAWRQALIEDNPHGKAIMAMIGQSQTQMLQSPQAGFLAMRTRFTQAPAHYLEWYLLHKPIALWGWNIRIGQGDIYVYPIVNSPFTTHVIWRAVAAICYGLNRFIALAALIGVVLMLRRRPAITASELSAPSTLPPWIVAALLIYVTVIYTIFQSEPRYSIPFRGFEMLAAITAVTLILRWVSAGRRRRRRASG